MAATHAGTPNSNMATPSRGVSRLGMMQARLQEQLMVEKESRLLEMAARQEAERDSTIQRVTKSSASSLSSSLSSLSMTTTLSGQGKVRKMFEDRRSTGYDKSYPLNPVKPGGPRGGPSKGVVRNNNNRGNSTERSGPGSYGGGYGQQQRSKSQAAPRGTAVRQPPLNRQNNNVNRSHHKSNPSLLDVNGGSNNNNNSAPGRFGAGRRSSNSPSVNGTSIGRGPSPAPPRREAPSPRKPSPSPFKSKSAPSRAQKSPAPFKSSKPKAPASLAPSPMPRSGSSASNAPPAPRTVPPGMAQCPICERCFNPDRIDKHTEICKKSQAKAKKRKVFDPVKMRNQGLETEKYVARGAHLKDVKPKKKDWRKQHQDFIATVRAAKGVKGYEAPPVDTSDYIQCPHCGRNFSEAAADRHIPKCSNIKSNKPTNKRR